MNVPLERSGPANRLFDDTAMKNLTKDSIGSHILTLAWPVAVGMLTQTAYQLVDLYFITRIGVEATAGVNAAGSIMFFVAALAQVLTVGTVPLIAQAAGRNDRVNANLVFNQSMTLSAALGLLMAALLYLLMRPYLQAVAADAATADAGATFLLWMLPGLVFVLPTAGFAAALRSTGFVRPIVVISTLTVIVNMLLAPVLIAGWGTGVALGAKGAGLATSIASLVGVVLFGGYFHRFERYLTLQRELMRPRFDECRRIIDVGLPAGVEFALVFASSAVVYYAIREFGAATQAGFGIGSRVLQIVLLPGMAIGLAVAPIVAQNFGARNCQRVRETFYKAVLIGTFMMVAITIVVQWWPEALVSMFDVGADAAAVTAAALFLQLMSWNFVAQGLIYVCSNMFQGLGNTVPSLVSSGARFVIFSVPALWLSTRPEFNVEHVWYLLIASIVLQAIVSLCLLRIEFRRRLSPVMQ